MSSNIKIGNVVIGVSIGDGFALDGLPEFGPEFKGKIEADYSGMYPQLYIYRNGL